MTKEEFVKILEDAGIHTMEDLANKVLEEVEAKKADIWKVKMGIRPKGPEIVDIY